MPSETDFLNGALSEIGADHISGIDDGSVNANHCLIIYPSLRRALLRMHNWNFAEDRAELAQGPTPPEFEFSFSYPLAANILKIKEYNGASVDTTNLTLYPRVAVFKIEGRNLLTNDGEVKVVYIKDITDPNIWDSLFYQTLQVWLSSKLATAIPKDIALSDRLLNRAISIFAPLAMAIDGQEGTVIPFTADDLIWGR